MLSLFSRRTVLNNILNFAIEMIAYSVNYIQRNGLAPAHFIHSGF